MEKQDSCSKPPTRIKFADKHDALPVKHGDVPVPSLASPTWAEQPGSQGPSSWTSMSVVMSIIVNMEGYPLVNKHSYGKWPFVVDFPIENGDFL